MEYKIDKELSESMMKMIGWYRWIDTIHSGVKGV